MIVVYVSFPRTVAVDIKVVSLPNHHLTNNVEGRRDTQYRKK